MSQNISLLTTKEISIPDVKEFCNKSNYYSNSRKENKLLIEQEYNPENVSRSYIMFDLTFDYIDVAINDYLEFDNLNKHKIELIKDCHFFYIQHNDSNFLYSFLNNFFNYFRQYSSQILIDDDYGNLFTIDEFKEKYLSQIS